MRTQQNAGNRHIHNLPRVKLIIIHEIFNLSNLFNYTILGFVRGQGCISPRTKSTTTGDLNVHNPVISNLDHFTEFC